MAIRLNSGGTSFLRDPIDPFDSREVFTWSAWVQDLTTSHVGQGSYFTATNGSFTNMIRWGVDDTGVFEGIHVGQPFDSDFSDVEVTQNVWKYWTLQRESIDGDIVLFVNAVEVARVELVNSSQGEATNIGVGLIPGTGLPVTADFSNMRFHTRALSAPQILAEMNSATVVDTDDWYDSWNFEEGSLGAGVNGHDWTIEGTPTFVADPDIGAGGTQYEQSVGGSLTPVGVLVKQARKVLAGGITPTGSPVKRVGKTFDGSITPSAGLVGVKTALIALIGTITPSGALNKSTRRVLAGTMVPAASLAKRTARPLVGSFTPAGSLQKQTNRILAGVSAPAGSLTRTIRIALVGTLVPTGSVIKRTARNLAGAIVLAGALATGDSVPVLLTPTSRNTWTSPNENQRIVSAPRNNNKRSS